MSESTIGLLALAVAGVANVVVQVLARRDAAREAAAQKALAAVVAAKVAQVKVALATANEVVAAKLDENTALTERVHDQTNGGFARLETALAAANATIAALRAEAKNKGDAT